MQAAAARRREQPVRVRCAARSPLLLAPYLQPLLSLFALRLQQFPFVWNVKVLAFPVGGYYFYFPSLSSP